MEQVYFDTIKHIIDTDNYDCEMWQAAVRIIKKKSKAKTACFEDPKPKIINFLNTWIVEKAIVNAYSDRIKFLGTDHEYLHDGRISPEPDCITLDNTIKVEIKTLSNMYAFIRWAYSWEGTFDNGHGCDVYLVYIKDRHELYVVDPKHKDKYELAERQINVKLYNV